MSRKAYIATSLVAIDFEILFAKYCNACVVDLPADMHIDIFAEDDGLKHP